jgi:hypothetical protein
MMISGTDDGVSDAKARHIASAPPTRFSADAKAAWDEAPEVVRAEVSRMEREFLTGFAKHRAAAERDGSLAEFHQMAARGKTTVKEALSRYVNLENQLRADPVKGLEIICQNVGMSLHEVAAKVLGLAPVAGEGGAHPAHESVAKFAGEIARSRFKELSEDIAFFLTSGRTKDLDEAYVLADRLNPVDPRADPIGAVLNRSGNRGA